MLCGLCFPSDRPLVACCCVWAWGVTPEIYRSGSLFWFFPTSLFFVLFAFLSTFHSSLSLFSWLLLLLFYLFYSSFLCFFNLSVKEKWILAEIFFEAHLAVLGWVWGLWSSGWNPNPIQVPPDDSIFDYLGSSWWLYIWLFGFLLMTPSLLFIYLVSLWLFQCNIWFSVWFQSPTLCEPKRWKTFLTLGKLDKFVWTSNFCWERKDLSTAEIHQVETEMYID